jgi:hypothetical protein
VLLFTTAVIAADTAAALLRPPQVSRRLQELMSEGRFAAAAAECPPLLGADAAAWEQWAYAFARAGALDALAPYVPPLKGAGEAFISFLFACPIVLTSV